MSSRPPKVTITLGTAGQVVKRFGTDYDDDYGGGGYEYEYVPKEKKRSVRERLGSSEEEEEKRDMYGDGYISKRQRGDVNRSSISPDMKITDRPISQHDLRHKLTRKTMDGKNHVKDREEHYYKDLREKLSRGTQPSVRTRGPEDMHEPIKISKSQYSPSRSMRIGSSQYSPRLARLSTNQYVPESKRSNRQQYILEPKDNGLSRSYSHGSSDDSTDVDHMEPLQKSYSAWTLDTLRRHSPNRKLVSSKTLALSRYMDELHQTSSVRVDSSRHSPLKGRDIRYAARPSYYTKETSVRPGSSKISPSLASVTTSRSPYRDEGHLTVARLLHALDLGEYENNFRNHKVDMTELKQMTEFDLKYIGIPMGPRKKILLAVIPRVRDTLSYVGTTNSYLKKLGFRDFRNSN